jgi:hypothetical protein
MDGVLVIHSMLSVWISLSSLNFTLARHYHIVNWSFVNSNYSFAEGSGIIFHPKMFLLLVQYGWLADMSITQENVITAKSQSH